MRDCPACRVPLHGYEEVCPSCGTKQQPTKSAGGSRQIYGTGFKPEEPRVNWIPFILVFIALGGMLIAAMNSTWIGTLMRGGGPVDPMAKVTYLDARNFIDQTLNQKLAEVGATNSKLTWKTQTGTGAPEERMIDTPVELAIETTLPSADSRKAVIDPVKDYMEKARLVTLTMKDSKSKATWTYNMTPATSTVEPDAGLQ